MTSTPAAETSRNRPRRFPWMALAVIAVWALAAAVLGMLYLRTPASQLLREARQALERQDFAKAKQRALLAVARDRSATAGLLVAGRAAAAEQNFDEALTYWSRIEDDHSAEAIEARCLAGDMLLMEQGNLAAAEDEFHRALKQDPDNVVAHRRLAYLLALRQDGLAAAATRLTLIRLRAGAWNDLHALALAGDPVEPAYRLEKYRAAMPNDPGVLTALARAAWNESRPADARQLLEQAVVADPAHASAQVELGHALLESDAADAFIRWHAALPQPVFDHPEIWTLCGQFARERGEPLVAIRCFGEAVRRDPQRLRAVYPLGQLLAAHDEPKLAEQLLSRAQLLERYAKTVEGTTPAITDEYRKAAELAEQLQLYWEAYGWSYLVLEAMPQTTWASERIARVQPRLAQMPLLRAPPNVHPASGLDLTAYPLPQWKSAAPLPTAPRAVDPLAGHITFEDQAATAGVAFQYFNGGEPLDDGMKKMYEFTGGGVAALDYDNDGWPDLYFTQGCQWPVTAATGEHLDRLFRNLGERSFADVTTRAGLAETRFSQGVAAGDYDNDGFVDLLVGNIGHNTLFHNNGDGTFSEVADAAITGSDTWTTSCVIADLNGDQLPDIYAANYLAGDDLFTRVCENGNSVVLCLPQWFSAAPDQLLLNRGDGRFDDASQAAGLERANGRGLGVVAAQLYGDAQLDLFVANDMDANFLLVNQAAAGNAIPQLADLALVQGLAADRNGRFQACMGIAAGDSNADGRVDLLVTNFDGETNTLYRQLDGGFFEDVTERSGLAESSFEMLGFGTQFLDADLDGDLDLLVANGQIDDARSSGRQYYMPPQFFENRGAGQFVEHAAEFIGPYFEGRYLGRGLARVDWNRDGREDAVVTHLDVPAALLTNTTASAGRSIMVRLNGVASARDALGAMLTLTTDKRQLHRQLMAGDGYHASNQRLVTFGLASAEHPVALDITWPSGHVQRCEHLRSNEELWIVEGRALNSRRNIEGP